MPSIIRKGINPPPPSFCTDRYLQLGRNMTPTHAPHGRGSDGFEDTVSTLLSHCLDHLHSDFYLGNERCPFDVTKGVTISLFPFSCCHLVVVGVVYGGRDSERCRAASLPPNPEANNNKQQADKRQRVSRFASSSSLIRSWAFVGHDCYAWGASTHARGADPFICPILVSCLRAVQSKLGYKET